MKKKSIISLAVSILICLFVAFAGSLVTTPAISTWYSTLNKTPLNPPNWVFAPVWTVLFILMGVSAWMIWEKGPSKKKVKNALYIFAAQLAANALWSIIFFGLKSPMWAFFEVIILWLLILATILSFHKISKAAAWLLVPYILWVSFASILNLSIWMVNR